METYQKKIPMARRLKEKLIEAFEERDLQITVAELEMCNVLLDVICEVIEPEIEDLKNPKIRNEVR